MWVCGPETYPGEGEIKYGDLSPIRINLELINQTMCTSFWMFFMRVCACVCLKFNMRIVKVEEYDIVSIDVTYDDF